VKALAIMHHDVVEEDLESSGFSGAGANVYKLERADFARHLDAIGEAAGAGQLQTIEGWADWGNRQPVLLTFDDGGVSAHGIIASMLEERGWRGHFFIATDWIGRPGFLDEAQMSANRAEALERFANGGETLAEILHANTGVQQYARVSRGH